MQQVKNLKDKTVAILATDGFEEIELTAPQEELAGYEATIHIISDKPKIRSWKNKQWGNEFSTDRLLDAANISDYDMLILPGGVINSDKLRRNEKAVDIIKKFYDEDKFIAAICHGPQILIETGLVKGKTITAHHAIKTDLKNAGANYEDLGALRDGNIITARGAQDVSEFLKKIIEVL
jgi:protease I